VHGAADVMVLCSVREPLGNAILEAMSMERAVVTSNCIGLSELVQDRINGRLVNPTSTNEIADVLIELVSPSTRTALGKRARHFVVENLSCEKISAQIARMYRDVLME
jgi:glycosyltransferase involved in cell wall biosynthesis